MWIELTDSPKFYLDRDGILINNTVFFLNGDNLEYTIQFLNSKIYTFYFDKICGFSGMGTRRWIKQYVEMLPIPKPNNDQLLQFIRFYQSRTDNQEDSIEDYISDILKLTSQERSFIRDLQQDVFK